MRKVVAVCLFSLFPVVLASCSKEPERHVKTPQELLDDELAQVDAQRAERPSDSAASSAELEAVALADEDRFDEENAEYELKRSSIGARSCPDSFEEEQLKEFKPGTAELKVLFANDGRVKQVTMNDLYKDSNVGDCVKRAFSSVQIRSYVGKERSVDWKLELKRESTDGAKK